MIAGPREGAPAQPRPTETVKLAQRSVTALNMRHLLIFLAFLLALVPLAQARAQGPEIEAVRQLAGDAMQLQKAGNHRDAAENYQRALEVLAETHPGPSTIAAMIGNNLGMALAASGDYPAAIAAYRRALALRRQLHGPDDPANATVLNNLASALSETGTYGEARTLFAEVIAIRERAHGADHGSLAKPLNNLAALDLRTGDYDAAREAWGRVLNIKTRVHGPDSGELAITLNNLAAVAAATADYATARSLYAESLALEPATWEQRRGDRARTLNNLGLTFLRLGDHDRARNTLRQAISLGSQAFGEQHPELAPFIHNLAIVERRDGNFGHAINLHRRALAVQEAAFGRVHTLVADSLNNLGQALLDAGQVDEAGIALQRGLRIREQVLGDLNRRTARSRYALGSYYVARGDLGMAEENVVTALSVQDAVLGPAHPETAESLDLLSVIQEQLGNREAAILFAKHAVNSFQDIRGNIIDLEESLQKSFIESRESVYRRTADLLIGAGRLTEAQQILALIREQEYRDFIRRSGPPTDTTADYLPEEAPWATRYREIADRQVAIGAELRQLRRKKARGGLDATESERMKSLAADARNARRAFSTHLEKLKDEFRELAGERAIRFGERKLDSLRALQGTLKRLGHGAVIVNYLVTPERLHLLLTTPESQLFRTVGIAETDLNQRIHAFRETLQDPRLDPRASARELYDVLIAPLESDLSQAGAETLMLALDGALRYLPVSALHDGERYVAERFRTVVFTAAATTSLAEAPRRSWSLAGLGVSKQIADFDPLPAVPAELENIVRREDADPDGVVPGIIHLDEAFTAETLSDILNLDPEDAFPVLHMASHFQFRPGTDRDSFLLLGSGNRLTLADLKYGDFPFHNLDLLTLSACETAVGAAGASGREIEGLGTLAQNQGARSVLATLWPVADRSTGRFMSDLYRIREVEGVTRAEALRRAQLGFLGGGQELAPRANGAPEQQELEGLTRGRQRKRFRADPDAPFAHPFFWAPFILMGNWL